MKKFKKIIPICLLALVLIIGITLLTPNSQAVTIVDSGTCGNNLTWTLDDAGTLNIFGTGPMPDYESSSSSPTYTTHPWSRVASSIKQVNISEGVTYIGNGAFYYCKNLTEVTIPDSVTAVGSWAFRYCAKLTNVIIPAGVTTIGGAAFWNCNSLSGIWIDEENPNYSSDDVGVLFNKDKTKLIQAPGGILGHYTIPDGVTTVDKLAFQNCDSLASVDIPDSVTDIDNEAFSYCDSLISINIPDGVARIGDFAFYGCCNLISVTLSNSVTSIGEHAFANCDSLTSVTIPEKVNTIRGSVFYGCDCLQNVTIPKTVMMISDEAFHFCDNLRNVYYAGTQTQWNNISIGSDNSELTSATIHYNHTHDYSLIPAKTVQPTCDQDGYVEYTCVLGDTYREYTPALGHKTDGDVTVFAPTCTVQGYTETFCDRCEQTVYTDFVDALGHDFNGKRTQILGCTEQGYTEIQCTRCSATTKTDYTDSVGHNVVVIQLREPTCTEEGISRIGTMCDRCGTVLAQPETIPALGHDFSSGICSRCQMSVQDEYIRIVKEAYALAPGYQLPYKATLTGTITKVKTPYDTGYKNVTVVMEVAGTKDMPITCYRMKGDGASKIGVGDSITVSGYIVNYLHESSGECEIEFVQGCTLDNWTSSGTTQPTEPTEPTTPPNVSNALQTGDKVVIFAPAYNKALSTEKIAEYYNKGVDITVKNGQVTGYGDSEIWTVTKNADGTYSFSNGGKNIGMADEFSNLNLGEKHDDWHLIKLGGSLYNVKNTGRGNFIEWYAFKENWSSYNSSYAATDDKFQLSFYVIDKGILSEKSASENVVGDLTGDASVNNDDVVLLLWHTLFPEDYPLEVNADLTGDGTVNNDDVVLLLWHTLFPEDYPL